MIKDSQHCHFLGRIHRAGTDKLALKTTPANVYGQTRAVLGFRGLLVSRFVEHVVLVTGGNWNGLAAVCVWVVMTGWGLSRTMKVDLVQRLGCKTNKELKHMLFVDWSHLITVYSEVLIIFIIQK